jgi:hypothetical protein
MNMKRALAICACAGFAAPAMAQPFEMTHNLVDDFVEFNTIQCAAGELEQQTTAQNTIWRAFDLAEFGLGDITVQEVEFGIEFFFAPTYGNVTEVTIELFQAPGGSAPAFGYELKGSASAEFEDQQLTIVSMAVEGCIDAGSTLVVAITPTDYLALSGGVLTGDVAWIGSNAFGETDDSYLSSTDCAIDPTPYRLVGGGFPNVHIVMNILGEEGHSCTGGECYADCDGSGTLDFFDFLCFQNAFAAGESYADCDDSGTLDFFDFLCFQNEFAAGCL